MSVLRLLRGDPLLAAGSLLMRRTTKHLGNTYEPWVAFILRCLRLSDSRFEDICILNHANNAYVHSSVHITAAAVASWLPTSQACWGTSLLHFHPGAHMCICNISEQTHEFSITQSHLAHLCLHVSHIHCCRYFTPSEPPSRMCGCHPQVNLLERSMCYCLTAWHHCLLSCLHM